ncbi:hypothetical protein GA830_12655 [Mesorhizobium sp. NBSH29]|uniref:hypothetical protein n=1 Tax=Mesorhizobium sp. NBSH29 TaxID=2654249 RepID=UPI0018964F87|nr:hypothetical protein [Mesorhizobium sp. NBSH29]QPC87501.1 hypothetical protein GA830_12655 [Mesorhizobium sp. NBSH29]
MAKPRINSPDYPSTHVSYQRECQMALEPSLTKLLAMACDAGWDERQATYAVMILAADQMQRTDAAGLEDTAL